MKFLVFLIIFLAIFDHLYSQQSDSNSSSIIDIIKAQKYIIKKIDSLNDFVILSGNVVLKDKNIFIYADSTVNNIATKIIECFGHIVIVDGDSIRIEAQYLNYNENTKDCQLKQNVKLTDKITSLFTDNFFYNSDSKIGNYFLGGKIIKKRGLISSQKANYNGQTKKIKFSETVLAAEGQQKIYTERLDFDEKTERMDLIEPAIIIQNKRKIFSDSCWYNFKIKEGELFKRSLINDSAFKLQADYMKINDSTSINNYSGSVVFETKEKDYKKLFAEHLITIQDKDYFMAYENAWIKFKQNKELYYVKADTFISGNYFEIVPDSLISSKRIDSLPFVLDSSKSKYFLAFHNVKMYNDSLQATCDSFIYTQHDSVAIMYGNPVIWLNQTQLVGDTVFIWLANNEIEKLKLYERGFTINRIDTTSYYNQLKGNSIEFFFKQNNIDTALVLNSCETIYYMLDNKDNFIGMNQASSQKIKIKFNDNKPILIKYFTEVKGDTFPMYLLPENKFLNGFHWLEEWRPKKWYEIFY